MARKRKAPAHANHERWLVSYADFITLLFAFFVVMFAASQTDRTKTKLVEESFKRALQDGQVMSALSGILGGSPAFKGKGNAQLHGPGGQQKLEKEAPLADGQYVELMPAMSFLNKELAEEVKKGQMQISMEPRGLVISFQQTAFFPSGTDEIPNQTFGTIQKVAEVIRKLPNPVRLEGHTDSVPIRGGGFRSNWELSAARSIAMMDLLVECCGVQRERLSIAGYADNAPVADNSTEEGRRRNRRVDIIILNKTGVQAEPGRTQR